MIPRRIEGGGATEETEEDKIWRSVPGQSGPDRKYELVQFAGKISWDFIDGEIAPP